MPVTDPTRSHEEQLFARGAHIIYGMDEVGRGAIAGPVAVGVAVSLPSMGPHPDGLRDSKMISEKKRTAIVDAVKEWTPAQAVGMASAEEVEQVGITKALALAGMRALSDVREQLEAQGLPTAGYIILDGSHNWLGMTRPFDGVLLVTQVKADRDDSVVAAASVLAKVERDTLMDGLAVEHPHYGWEKNKGYGAPAHYAGIAEHGQVPGLHRSSWIK